MRNDPKVTGLMERVLQEKILQKAVFSRSLDKQVKKAVAKIFAKGKALFVQVERFTADNKAIHENIPFEEASARLSAMAMNEFVQTDLFTSEGFCEILVSAKGHVHIASGLPPVSSGARTEIAGHDRKKQYLLDPVAHAAFLSALGVSDASGVIFEKKRSKFRQINRFLELLNDVYDKLPPVGSLTVCDLCCGKSYLTFAVYYYLTEMRKRTVTLFGVDRKTDVIDFCRETAERLGCTGMHFLAEDINIFDPQMPVDMVVSLHACDIATDMVLDFAVRREAKLILSTPCCHHEMMHSIRSEPLTFITRHSMLKQKLCDAATDALRCLKLEAFGYAVETLELIDAEETPKNVMIRAHMPSAKNPVRMRLALQEYRAAAQFLGTTPTLGLQ